MGTRLTFDRGKIPFRTLAVLTALGFCLSAGADDWPGWRGPNRDGRSAETGLLQEWPAGGPPQAWQVRGVGTGYSGVAVADGRVLTMGDVGDASCVIAVRESDGGTLWSTGIGPAGGHQRYPGTRATPTVDGGMVFALDQNGIVAALNAESGELLWKKNLERELGGRMMSGWRYSESVLVDGERVVCTPGGPQGTVAALNRKTGQVIWRSKGLTDPAAYASIVVGAPAGRRQYIVFTGNSVAGLDPETGDVLWKASRPGKTAVIPTPVVQGDLVFVTSGYGVGCNLFRISKDGGAFSARQVYANTDMANHHGGAIAVGAYVYATTNGRLVCMEIATGKVLWAQPSVGKGALVYADGHLVLRSEKGPVALIRPGPDGLHEVSRFNQPNRSGSAAWPHPVIANGKLYIRDQDVLICYNISQ